jgi:hypothetical protein
MREGNRQGAPQSRLTANLEYAVMQGFDGALAGFVALNQFCPLTLGGERPNRPKTAKRAWTMWGDECKELASLGWNLLTIILPVCLELQ